MARTEIAISFALAERLSEPACAFAGHASVKRCCVAE